MVYDCLDRLTQVTSNMFGTASYSYDVMDNLTHVRITGGQARDQYYCYDSAWRLANIKTSSCSGTTVVGLGYDVQGNLANKNGQKYTFDYGNRLRDVTGKESYRYDGLGRRVLASSATLGNIVSLYTKAGQLWYQNDQRRGANLNYIYLGGSLVAIREMVGSAQTIKYQHTDALGTPIAVTGANKALIQTSEYEPYGQLLNRTLTDGPGFTGHVQDAATGLTYMQQRYYNQGIGRFLSTDPVTAYESGDSRHINRYAYAYNNPYKFTDPDGRGAREHIDPLVDEPTTSPLPADPTVLPTTQVIAAPAQTMPTMTVYAPRTVSIDIPWSGLGIGISSATAAAISAPLLFFFTPNPCPDGHCGDLTMESRKYNPGFWAGDKGAEEWGRRNKKGAAEGRRRFHGIKQGDKGQGGGKGRDDYGTNPDTGEVQNPQGETIGDLNDG